MPVIYIKEKKQNIFKILKKVADMMNLPVFFASGDSSVSEAAYSLANIKSVPGDTIFIVSNGRNRLLHERACIFAVGEISETDGIIRIPPSASCVITGTENIKNIEPLKNVSQIITCGQHEKDTLTLSSMIGGNYIKEDYIILNLQRSVIDINGIVVESFEQKVRFPSCTGCSPEDITAAAAVLIYCGVKL